MVPMTFHNQALEVVAGAKGGHKHNFILFRYFFISYHYVAQLTKLCLSGLSESGEDSNIDQHLT